MSKKQSYPRAQYRRLLRGWLSRHKRVVAGISLIFALTVAAEVALLQFLPSHEWTRYTIVALLAGTFVAYCWAIHTLFLAHEGQALNQLRGAWGEDNTSTELRAAQRQDLVWRSIDSIEVEGGDIDHFVITRHGGVVVVDSKWCSEIDDEKRATFAFTASRAAKRGETLLNTVSTRSHGRHRGSRQPMTVTPVVVVWGAAQSSVGDAEVVDGVAIVRGRSFRTWLARLERETITQRTAFDLADRIEEFDQKRRKVLRDREQAVEAGART